MSRARIITEDNGEATGVVVRIIPDQDTEASIRVLALEAIKNHGNEYGEKLNDAEAMERLAAMSHVTTGPMRWIPAIRDDEIHGQYIEDAEAGSRGSFIGRYWSYPW